MTTPGEQLAAIIREMAESPNLISKTVIAVLTDNVVDGCRSCRQRSAN